MVFGIYGFSEKLGLRKKQFLEENTFWKMRFFGNYAFGKFSFQENIRIRKYEVQTTVFGIYGFSEKLGLRKNSFQKKTVFRKHSFQKKTVFRKRVFQKLRFFIKIRSQKKKQFLGKKTVFRKRGFWKLWFSEITVLGNYGFRKNTDQKI